MPRAAGARASWQPYCAAATRRGRPECVLFLLCAAAVASCASGAAPLCGVGTEVIDTSASPPFSPCARATAPLPNPGLYKCRSTYIPPDSAGRGEAVCDADNNAACSRNCVEAYAEELRAQLVAAEEEGAAAAFHAEVSAGRGGHATHFWPLLFDVASGTIQANGRNISHEGDVAKGELSVGKTLAEWIMDITCENCTLSEETIESQRRGVVPIKGVPGAICREDADSPGAGFCVSEPELVNVTDAQSVAAAADGYLQRFRAALDACQSGAFVYVLMPSTLVGGHSAHLGGLHVDEWVFYASAPTPAGTVVAYGYRNVAHAPVLPCSAAYNNLCSIANSVTLVGKALDAVTRASTPWEFEGALNKMSYSDDYVIAGGFYVFAKHYSGVVVAHGAVSKFVGMTTTAIVSTVSPALDGVQFNADSTAAASQPGGSWLSYKWPTREDQVRIANGQLTNASEAAQDVKVALHMEFEFPLAGSVQQFYLAVGYNHIPRPERCADVWRDDLGQPSRAAVNCTDTAAHAAQNKCSAAFASPCAVSNTMRLVSDVATEVHVDETLDELLRKVSTSDRFAGLGQLSAPFGAVIVDSEDDGTLMSVPRFYPQNYSTLRQLYMDGFGQVGDSFDCFIRKLKRIATSQFGGSDTGLLGGWLLAPWGVVSNGTVLEVTEHALYARGFVYDSHRYFYVAGFGTRAPRPTTSFGGRPCGREHATACALSNARLAKAALLWRVLASAPENGGLSSDSSEVQADAACWTQMANSSDDGSGRRLLQAAPIRQATLNDTFTALTYANDHLLGDFSGAQVYVLRLDDSQEQACIVASTISASHVETSTCSPTIELGSILPDGTDRLAWVQAHTDAADEGQFGEHSQSFKGHSDVLVTNATGQPQLLTVTVTRVSASGDGRTYLIATGVPADLGFVSCGNGTCPKHSTCESSEQEFCECDDGYVADIDTLSCIKLESSSGGLPNWAIGVIAGLGALGIIAVGTAWLRRRHLRHKYESAWIIDPRELETVEPFTVLGRGNFGTVFLGRFRGTLVALKRVSLGSPAARSGSASVTNGSSNGEASTSSQTSSTTTVLEPAGTAKARMLKHAGSERSVLAAVQKADSGSSASTSTSSVPDGHHVASIVIGGQLGLTVEGTGSSSGIDSGSGGGSGSGGLVGGSCASLSGCLSPGGLVSDNGSAISNRGSSRGMSSSRRAHIFRKEIRLMVRLRHPHIVTVLGATKESEPLLVLEYLPRGTLRDLLLNPSSDLPANLCISMARDVCSGLRYLHDSTPAIIHGDIKAANVLVSDSFECKLSDFGLSSTKQSLLRVSGGRRVAVGTPFYMAPELLDGQPNSEASDVYSFGMLLWELFSRRSPYSDQDDMSTREILQAVRSPETKLRPTITHEMRQATPPTIVQLIEDCLLANPDRRPSLVECDAAIDSLQSKGGALRKADLFDPAANTRRSMLLERMLPPDVAARLTRGEKVGALRYEMVSIFFCDIVNFTHLSDELGDPELVTDMLDRLYSRFDSLVREFDLFKLETIGDCYMVAGGLAKKQRRTHSARVAAFALAAIQEAADTLVDESRPELGALEIRAGFHCGPVVGGLLGSDKLKFSVYGDTVNTASRCESHGLAQRLTTSDAGAAALREQAPWLTLEERGRVDIKGKGVQTLWVAGGEGGDLRAHLCELDAADAADEESDAEHAVAIE